ncbi:uncharacterized protein LOC122756508 [Drosophila santomea]|uniref:uncharacterized protein LOC122756508 n=1 Tax=Drosophila santomea TaxID=129105 RepID=UPI001CC9DC3D|nr:uncharacterized protein LOC122756508 [Drosophila santomea]
MKDDQPVKQSYYPKNPKMQVEINAKVDELLQNGCIEPSRSPYSSPIVIVKKKTGQWRLCVDFRQINAKSVKDAYPMPMINYILDQLREAKYISSLDLKDGHWQIPLEAASRQYTAFTVPGKGLFQWKVMPFGLHSASATFQRALDQVIGPEMMPLAFAYQDVCVPGETFEAVKTRLVADPFLACPDFTRTFVLQTDASDYGLGAILTQHSEQGERVISYSSRALNGAEKNYSATEKECSAIVWAVRKLRPYLEGYHFKVITDHMALKWLNSIESPTGRIARWALELQQFDLKIAYRKGRLNIVADALSRQPLQETSRRLTAKEEGQPDEQQECRWVEEMRRKMKQDPQKYPDYLEEAGQLYRHIPHRAGNEDVVSWKLCVPIRERQRVMAENHDMPTAGHLGSRRTMARVAARYHWPGMHRTRNDEENKNGSY